MSFVFGFFVAVTRVVGPSLLIDRYYKRFHECCSATLGFLGGTKPEMSDVSRKKVLEIARAYEANLARGGVAQLDFGKTRFLSELAVGFCR